MAAHESESGNSEELPEEANDETMQQVAEAAALVRDRVHRLPHEEQRLLLQAVEEQLQDTSAEPVLPPRLAMIPGLETWGRENPTLIAVLLVVVGAMLSAMLNMQTAAETPPPSPSVTVIVRPLPLSEEQIRRLVDDALAAEMSRRDDATPSVSPTAPPSLSPAAKPSTGPAGITFGGL